MTLLVSIDIYVYINEQYNNWVVSVLFAENDPVMDLCRSLRN